MTGTSSGRAEGCALRLSARPVWELDRPPRGSVGPAGGPLVALHPADPDDRAPSSLPQRAPHAAVPPTRRAAPGARAVGPLAGRTRCEATRLRARGATGGGKRRRASAARTDLAGRGSRRERACLPVALAPWPVPERPRSLWVASGGPRAIAFNIEPAARGDAPPDDLCLRRTSPRRAGRWTTPSHSSATPRRTASRPLPRGGARGPRPGRAHRGPRLLPSTAASTPRSASPALPGSSVFALIAHVQWGGLADRSPRHVKNHRTALDPEKKKKKKKKKKKVGKASRLGGRGGPVGGSSPPKKKKK